MLRCLTCGSRRRQRSQVGQRTCLCGNPFSGPYIRDERDLGDLRHRFRPSHPTPEHDTPRSRPLASSLGTLHHEHLDHSCGNTLARTQAPPLCRSDQCGQLRTDPEPPDRADDLARPPLSHAYDYNILRMDSLHRTLLNSRFALL
jgi:hypothetical protein